MLYNIKTRHFQFNALYIFFLFLTAVKQKALKKPTDDFFLNIFFLWSFHNMQHWLMLLLGALGSEESRSFF